MNTVGGGHQVMGPPVDSQAGCEHLEAPNCLPCPRMYISPTIPTQKLFSSSLERKNNVAGTIWMKP